MKKRLIAVSVALLMSISLLGILVGCGDDGGSTKATADIAEIQVFNQDSNGITVVNYQVVLKQTPAEWIALSDEDRNKLALGAYNAAVEKAREGSVTNYNIIGKTSPSAAEAEDAGSTLVAFVLDKEANTVKVFGVDQQQTGEVAIDPALEG